MINSESIIRMLETYLLPNDYLPSWFSVNKFKTFLENNNSNNIERMKKEIMDSQLYKVLKDDIYVKPKMFIPYTYLVDTSIDKSIRLSIIHPWRQIQSLIFINNYSNTILYLTKKSNISLRHPINKQKQPSKYDYEYYNIPCFLHSKECIAHEERFSKLRIINIASCFSSIYTHSVSWAVLGKDFAKSNLGSFKDITSKYDKVMQENNYKETNGILVGGELSRIFVEIILQKIDLNILDECNNMAIDEDSFVIRRYIDTFYIFGNSDEENDIIQTIIINKLREYNLYLNQKKTISQSRPFYLESFVKKNSIKNYISDFINKNISEFTAINIVNNIKQFMFLTKIDYLFGDVIIEEICLYLENKHPKEINELEIIESIKLFNYCLNLDFTLKTLKVYKKCVNTILKNTKNRLRQLIIQEIGLGVRTLIKTIHINNKINNESLLVYELLTIIPKKINSFSLEPKFINEYLIVNKNNLSYFEIIYLLDYFQNDERYEKEKNDIIDKIKYKFRTFKLSSTEDILLLFDFINCPYVLEEKKITIVGNIPKIANIKNKAEKEKKISNIISNIKESKGMYVDWYYNVEIN